MVARGEVPADQFIFAGGRYLFLATYVPPAPIMGRPLIPDAQPASVKRRGKRVKAKTSDIAHD